MVNEVFLEKIHIHDFLSLHDVELSLKPLTILVGPNASGKSNVLSALELLQEMMVAESLPRSLTGDNIKKTIWAGGADKIKFELLVKVNQKLASYKLELQSQGKNRIAFEKFVVDDIAVILVEEGQGRVIDENNENSQDFQSHKLALKSAGDYGYKPVTKALAKFIRNWEFYDFRPNKIRVGKMAASVVRKSGVVGLPNRMDNDGEALGYLLYDWSESDKDRFEAMDEALNDFCQLNIEQKGDELYLLEGYPNNIPLEMASDGILRLLAYQALLIEPESPSLITIEEPERNLHPAALMELGSLLKDLSRKTQVIITTHSSQLLDMFDPDDLSNDLEVILLRNRHGQGTEVINIEKITEDRESLRDWIDEFGIGSAIFESQLLQDMMEI